MSGRPTVAVEDLDGGVRKIVLDRPGRLNAIDFALCDELGAALRDAADDGDVGAIVLTGAGGHFSAGGDLHTLLTVDARQGSEFLRRLQEAVKLITFSSKPVVAAVEGACAGGAVGLALASDIVVGGSGTRFSIPFLRVGLVPDMGVAYLLSRRAGRQRAYRMLVSGEAVVGDAAAAAGLIDVLVSGDELQVSALDWAHRLACLPPLTLAESKRLLFHGEPDFDAFLATERHAAGRCFGAAEAREGIAAFLDKRPPAFPRKVLSADG